MIGQISARTSSEPAPNRFGASSEPASIMEFGSKTILSWEWPAQDTMPGHVRLLTYLKQLSREQHRHGADTVWGKLDGVHIGATWRIRLNRSCAAAMRPFCQITLTTCCCCSCHHHHCCYLACLRYCLPLVGVMYFFQTRDR